MSETQDALFGGAVSLRQPARRSGYRVNVDALLLAAFATRARRAKHAFDLGSGVGAVALSLLHLGGAERVTLVENDPTLARLALQNLADNGWAGRGSVEQCDVRAAQHRGEADLIVCNPPYTPPGRGRMPATPTVRPAKVGELEVFIDAARRIAGKRCRVCFVYPAPESVALFSKLKVAGIEPKRLRFVHGTRTSPARILLIEAQAAKPGGLAVEPPLVEMLDARTRSEELERLLSSSA